MKLHEHVLKRHPDHIQYRCGECDLNFTQLAEYQDHTIATHGDEKNRYSQLFYSLPRQWSGRGYKICPICTVSVHSPLTSEPFGIWTHNLVEGLTLGQRSRLLTWKTWCSISKFQMGWPVQIHKCENHVSLQCDVMMLHDITAWRL